MKKETKGMKIFNVFLFIWFMLVMFLVFWGAINGIVYFVINIFTSIYSINTDMWLIISFIPEVLLFYYLLWQISHRKGIKELYEMMFG